MKYCLLVVALIGACHAQPVRASIERALPRLQSSAAKFVEQRACFSCHHNALPIWALRLADERGFQVDVNALTAVESKTFHELSGPGAIDTAVQASNLNDPAPNETFLLMAAESARLPRDLTKAVYAARLINWQRDGHWVTSDFRPPHSASTFMATASAVRAIAAYAPDELKQQQAECFARAREWLAKNKPESTEDAAFRLLGLVWTNAEAPQIEAASRDLLALQKPGSGWRQSSNYQPDAYATGEAIYALRVAGKDAPLSAIKFLTSSQAEDGTWHVHTRMLSPADVSPRYFTTGFPYAKDEYISYAGSVWAVMGLLSTLPKTSPTLPASASTTPEPPAWIRTALWGTQAELDKLDPTLKTDKGTTLMMAAATDVAKVKSLRARGADTTGALAVAAAYRGTADSIQELAAGADLNPKRKPPIAIAVKTGDIATVKTLLANGAQPAPALGDAITFGYADIVELLLRAGASPTLTQGDGVNLLHWAAITGRTDVIPVLAKAGTKINALDDQGYTPLMYAATIDFGDTKTLDALLKAGADPRIKNDDKRTPYQQAARLHLKHLAAHLQTR